MNENSRAPKNRSRRLKSVVSSLGALLLSASVLAGCGSAAPHTQAASHEVLNVALNPSYNPNWFAPIASDSSCITITGGVGRAASVYLPLLEISNTGTSINLKSPLSLATSIAVSRNDTVYTIHMKRWQWSDGRPVTAADVVYDWNLIDAASQSNPGFGYCFAGEGGVPNGWKSVQAVGNRTVVVTTTKPVNPLSFEINGLSQLIPVPKFAWDKYHNVNKELSWINNVANKPTNPVYQVVDGAYHITKVAQNQYFEYQANPKFPGGKPKIQTIIYRYETSDASEFEDLLKGNVQVGYLPFSLYDSRSKLKGYHILAEPQMAYFSIVLNMSPKSPSIGNLLTRLYVRQALQYAINQRQIVKNLFHGLAISDYGPVPKISSSYDKHLPNFYPYSPSTGKRLLEKHGWKLQNGVMEKNGLKLAFTLMVPAGSSTWTNAMQLVQQSWAAEGIKVTLNTEPVNTVDDLVGSPAGASKWNAVSDWYWIYAPDYYPSGAGIFNTNGGYNGGKYSSAVMDRLIKQTELAGTPAQVQARMNAYERYAWQQLPVLFIPTPDNLVVVSNRVKGYQAHYNPILEDALYNQLQVK